MCMTTNDNTSENKSRMKITVFRHKKYKDIYLTLSIGNNSTFGTTKDLEEAMSNYFLYEKFNCWTDFYDALSEATSKSKSESNSYSPYITYMDSRIFEIDGYKTEYSSLFKYDGGTDSKFAVVKATPKGGGEVALNVVDDVLSSSSELNNFKISVRRISQSYPVG